MNDSESTQVQYASFLVRLWRNGPSAPEECDVGWQGEVEHIQSGWRLGFDSLSELWKQLGQLLTADEGQLGSAQ